MTDHNRLVREMYQRAYAAMMAASIANQGHVDFSWCDTAARQAVVDYTEALAEAIRDCEGSDA